MSPWMINLAINIAIKVLLRYQKNITKEQKEEFVKGTKDFDENGKPLKPWYERETFWR